MPNESRSSYEDGMLDIIGAEDIEVTVVDGPNDTKVLTVNTKNGCRLRICRITGNVWIKDTSTVDWGTNE